ncbi:MAG: alpha-1,2-fucosyltransferase [Bacteroidales bacterium]|nr:alpha-1,2-fucosyltransferase [Bacteroidales bacterium]
MAIIVLSGGLGNQMFQYAFFLAKEKNGEKMYLNTYSLQKEGTHNGYELEKLFRINAPYASSFSVKIVRKLLIFQKKKGFHFLATLLLSLLRLSGINYIQEKGYAEFNKQYLNLGKDNTLYFGFWQSPKYFESINETIRNTFSFNKLNVSEKTNSLLKKIKETESISIHIRRGDYLSEQNKKIYSGICTRAYYHKALSFIEQEVKDPLYIVFSDDPEWSKRNFPLKNVVYADWNSGKNSWEDMFLMLNCKHNILANSTFSWWGAWLNAHPQKKVLAPAKFMNNYPTPDIYPPDWIIIDSV